MQIAGKMKKFLHLRTKSKVKTNVTSNMKRPWEGFQLLDGRAIFGICRRWTLFSSTTTSLFPLANIATSFWKEQTTKNWKSYQFFFKGNVKKLETKLFENKTYVRANLLPSMKRTPYRVCTYLRCFTRGLYLSRWSQAAWLREMQPRQWGAFCHRRFN